MKYISSSITVLHTWPGNAKINGSNDSVNSMTTLHDLINQGYSIYKCITWSTQTTAGTLFILRKPVNTK